MSTFGKVLLVLNLLASGGFVYLATQDWGKNRQNIAAAGLRQVVLLQGLPLTNGTDATGVPAEPEAEVPFPVEMAGGVPVKSVSPAWLKKYFDGAGGPTTENRRPVVLTVPTPVPSQLAEVRRVWGLIDDGLTKADGPAAKAQIAGAFLRLQPETLDERVEVEDLIARRRGDELTGKLKAKFDQVLNATAGADLGALGAAEDTPEDRLRKAAEVRGRAAKDLPERQARLAHLLVHLDPDPGWQKRVMMVVGVRRWVAAVGAQAVRFRDMAARVERLTAEDQDRFAAEYALLRGQAIQRTQTVRDTAEVRARLEAQLARDRDFVTQRRTQIEELRVQLARVKAEVDALLARQKVTEDALFAVQLEVGRTLEQIYQLEDDLTRAERARYGSAGK